MERAMKQNLLGYLLISAVTFSSLLLVENAGFSVLIFVAIQFVCLYRLAPKKKPLLMSIPIFILALNSFISASPIWRGSNPVVAIVLYSVTALWLTDQFSVKDSLLGFVFKTLINVTEPFSHFKTPFRWCLESQQTHMPIIKRVVIGICVSIPCLIFVSTMLASADAIFSQAATDFFLWVSRLIRLDIIGRVLLGIFAGLYLFGMLYHVSKTDRKNIELKAIKARNGDLIVLNIVLTSVLLVYTLFVIIQFRYLFASAENLPIYMTFESYARRGFFELMILTGINIAFILVTVWLTKDQTGLGAKLTKALCLYLCAVTTVLLASSFYRMWLHGSDDGLTRMRFLVFGFLIFKAVGIAATFVYIAKPKFNIIAVYCLIALTYYLFLNIVPIDSIVARSQINRYFDTGRAGISYVLTLSPDAGPQISRLLESGSAYTRDRTLAYYEMADLDSSGWRQWNLSVNRFNRLRNSILE
ncbi:MAG: DUF4173 domain-containing protein [Defluviitaleaceae bacterium]|nr:DUF4173 domain-containing protein [Defluviitaleaceae bacterium]